MKLTREQKSQIIMVLTVIIDAVKNCDCTENSVPKNSNEPVEMLTIKECTELVSGLSEHTIRKWAAQDKINSCRVGEGKRGKILINKASLMAYLEGNN